MLSLRSRRLLALTGTGVTTYLLVKTLVLTVYAVPTASMDATVRVGDRIAVQRLAEGPLRRGDVVVFDGAGSFGPDSEDGGLRAHVARALWQTVGVDVRTMYVKRVIGVGGDVLRCCDSRGRVEVGAAGGSLLPLDEPYVAEPDERAFGPVEVPAGHLWVMGDHRGASEDSRHFVATPYGGMVPLERVQGRVVAVVWPPSHASLLPPAAERVGGDR